MGDESLGTTCPDPYRLVLDLGCGDRGVPLFYRSRHLPAIFRQTKRVCRQYFTGRSGAHPRACAQTFADGATVSLDHGRSHVDATVDRLSAEGWPPVSLGDLSLDRGRGVDRIDHFSRDPRLLLYGLLGN